MDETQCDVSAIDGYADAADRGEPEPCCFCKSPVRQSDAGSMNVTGVFLKEGWFYDSREGGVINYTQFHICRSCFESKLMPLMESAGAQSTHHTIDL